MNRLTLTKDKVKIVIESTNESCTINYTFAKNDDEKNQLDDYIYLLDKILLYMKSGEYEVVEEKESA